MFDGTKEAGIVISTYAKISMNGRKEDGATGNEDFEKIKAVDWGLVILDEVQVVPAQTFRQVITCIKSHCKLGLTATLVREDEKIRDLNYLIGPKLYEANWQDLTDSGFLARVQCIEVQCEMTPDFYEEYLKAKRSPLNEMFYVCNPNKFIACEYLIRLHERRGDKILVFSDKIFAQEYLAKSMTRAFINGSCSHNERMNILEAF
jgi:DNA excision repair protein ERCC-3